MDVSPVSRSLSVQYFALSPRIYSQTSRRVIGSGSGETASLVVMAQRAKKFGAKLVTLTIHPEASIGSLADAVVTIPGATPKSSLADTVKSIQPMGNAFEQMSWLVYDAIIMILMDKLHKEADEMFKLHANLE